MSEWIKQEEFLKKPKEFCNGHANIQRSGCKTTGDIYIRVMTEKYKDLPEKELKEKVVHVVETIAKATGEPPVLDPTVPLWIQAEFCENMLDFELHPPCGCKPDPKFLEGDNGGKQT